MTRIPGIFKYVAQAFGMTTIDLLGDPGRALFAVIAVICWQFTPFYMVYFLAVCPAWTPTSTRPR